MGIINSVAPLSQLSCTETVQDRHEALSSSLKQQMPRSLVKRSLRRQSFAIRQGSIQFPRLYRPYLTRNHRYQAYRTHRDARSTKASFVRAQAICERSLAASERRGDRKSIQCCRIPCDETVTLPRRRFARAEKTANLFSSGTEGGSDGRSGGGSSSSGGGRGRRVGSTRGEEMGRGRAPCSLPSLGRILRLLPPRGSRVALTTRAWASLTVRRELRADCARDAAPGASRSRRRRA